jgi:hypothetical protein
MKRQTTYDTAPYRQTELIDEEFDGEPPNGLLDEIARCGIFSPPPTVRDSYDNRVGYGGGQAGSNPFVARYYDALGSRYERRCYMAEELARVRCGPAIEALRIASLPGRKRFASRFAAMDSKWRST